MSQGIKSVEVRVRLSITRILEIDIVGQTFTVEFQLEASWIDDSLAGRTQDGNCDEYEGFIIDTEATNWTQPDGVRILGSDQKFFSPMIHFRNSIELSEVEEWGQIFPKETNGIVCYRMKTRGKFQQCMGLHNFPLDRQELFIILSSGHEANSMNPSINEPTDRRYAFKRVELRQNLSGKYRSFANIRSFTFGNEYDMQEGVKFTTGITAKDESASLRQYPTLSMAVVVTRKAGYWAFNVVLPLYLITSVSCASFAVPPEDIADRCSITMTMMLTTVAYKYLISDRLPTISYLTLIDQYVLLNMLLQVAFVILIVVQGGVANSSNYQANSRPNQIRFVIFLVASWTLFHLALVICTWLWKLRLTLINATASNKLWVRALKPDANMHTLYQDFLTARAFLVQRSSNHNPLLKKSLIKLSTLVQARSDSKIETTLEQQCDGGLSMAIKHWTWTDAEETWANNGMDPAALRSDLREDFSVVTFPDEVSADEFIRVMTFFVVDKSKNKPLLRSFQMMQEPQQRVSVKSMDLPGTDKSEEGLRHRNTQSPEKKSSNLPQLVRDHILHMPDGEDKSVVQEQEIKIEKLNPDWDVFSLDYTAVRNKKILMRTGRIIQPSI